VIQRLLLGLISATALLALPGCHMEEQVSAYAAPKDPTLVSWTLPADWRQVPHKPQLQYAAFATADGDQSPQVTVSFLFPNSPGATDLLLNVNRWRGQLGLDQLADPAELNNLVQTTRASATPIQWVDMTSPAGQRMRAAIVPREDRIWFFKMTGPASAVESQKEAFDTFVKSAKYLSPAGEPLLASAGPANSSGAESKAPAGHPPVSDASTSAAPPPSTPTPLVRPPTDTTSSGAPTESAAGGLKYTLPPGWTTEQTPRPMRVATLSTGGDKPATVIITRLSTSFGAMKMNLDRWRAEVGLPPVQSESDVKETPIKIGSQEGQLVDFSGLGKDGSTPTRSLIARRTAGDSVWFFKILGPTQTVTTERPNFEKFLASVQLPGEGK
jgi:hypothetical protein